jgi:hypothetical protein
VAICIVNGIVAVEAGGDRRRNRPVQEGNLGPAIPVLEQQLHDRRIPVPSRS